MSRVVSVNEAFEPASVRTMIRQPHHIWLCVESLIREQGGHFRAKTEAERRGRLFPEPGWLSADMIEPLHAVDVPVAKCFTACMLSERPRG